MLQFPESAQAIVRQQQLEQRACTLVSRLAPRNLPARGNGISGGIKHPPNPANPFAIDPDFVHETINVIFRRNRFELSQVSATRKEISSHLAADLSAVG